MLALFFALGRFLRVCLGNPPLSVCNVAVLRVWYCMLLCLLVFFCVCFVGVCSFLRVFAQFCVFSRVFECFCALGALLGASRPLLGVLGGLLDALGALLGALGALLGALGALLGALGALLGTSQTPLGRNLRKIWVVPTCWGPTWSPKSSQVRSKSFKNRRQKKQLIFKRFVLAFLVFSIDFHFKAKNVDFVKNSVFPIGNHEFQSSDFMGQNTFLNSKTFQKIYFFAKKNFQNEAPNP